MIPDTVPDPLAGTGYPSEHENFACLRYLGTHAAGDNYPLPCRAPRDEWRSPLRDTFVLTAWWPPTMNVVHEYKAAGFSTLLGGNIAPGCQENGSIPNPATATQAFECVARALPEIERAGLLFTFGLGFYNASGMAGGDLLLGGEPSAGGLTDDPNPGVRWNRVYRWPYPTDREVAWVATELARRNLTRVVAAYELHDDVTTNDSPTQRSAAYLRRAAPSILPLTNTGPMGASSLYSIRSPVMSPEEYAVDLASAADNATRAMAVQEGAHHREPQPSASASAPASAPASP